MDTFVTWMNNPNFIRALATSAALIAAAYVFVVLLWKLPRWLTRLFQRPSMSWGNMLETGKVGEIADWFIWRFTFFGAAAIIFASAAAWIDGDYAQGLRVLGLSILFGAACTCSGWLLGLLFGVPRTLARGQPTNQPAPGGQPPPGGPPPGGPQPAGVGPPPTTGGQPPPAPAAPAAAPNAAQRANASRVANGVNTNLEDISDWLTKTIVGVGLTQLYSVPHFLWAKAEQLNTFGFGWTNHGQLLALSLFVYFATGGFWLGYVGTRTILTALLNMIDDLHHEPKDLSFSDDANTQKIRTYVMTATNTFDPAKSAAVVEAMRQTGVQNVSLTSFLNSLDFSAERAQVVRQLNLP
jgi:hypothetical protein